MSTNENNNSQNNENKLELNEKLENQNIENQTNIAEIYDQLNLFDDNDNDNENNSKNVHTEDEKKIRKVKELSIFTFSKALAEYIFVITKNAPKQYRWSLVARMQQNALDLIECLYLANAQKGEQRFQLQIKADSKLKIISFLAEMSQRMKVISVHQYNVLAKKMYDCKITLWGWIKCKI